MYTYNVYIHTVQGSYLPRQNIVKVVESLLYLNSLTKYLTKTKYQTIILNLIKPDIVFAQTHYIG